MPSQARDFSSAARGDIGAKSFRIISARRAKLADSFFSFRFPYRYILFTRIGQFRLVLLHALHDAAVAGLDARA